MRHLLITVITFCFFSCKKNYTCTCEQTIKSPYTTQKTFSKEFSDKKIKKKEAEATCKAAENILYDSYYQNGCTTCSVIVNCTIK